MLSKVLSGTNIGLNSVLVTVEVDIAALGLPSFTIVGLADRAIEEAKERVRAALRNSNCDFPPKRITVNLAPADLPKVGPVYDLAIATGIMLSSGQINKDVSDTLMVGEVSLDGSLRHTQGILPITIFAKKTGFKNIFVPSDNAKEAAIIDGISVFAFHNLSEVFGFLMGSLNKTPEPKTVVDLEKNLDYEYDFSQIKGQEQAKRALEIAAAGGHNVLMKGPPGTGKTMLARAFASILPPITLDEALEVTKIYSITGNLSKDESLITVRPFRAPHHTASYVGLIGGGNTIKPGEVSLAHRGVLFLDELPEFTRQVLESLRQPLEDRKIVISRASGSLDFPTQFILISAQNPCPCGFLGSSQKSCICMPGQVARYQKKISGPLLDRIDIHIDVPAVDVSKLTSDAGIEPSKTIQERVKKARKIQEKRFNGYGILNNGEMNNKHIKQFCILEDKALELLKLAIVQMRLSARSYHRVLKLSKTIADLARSANIQTNHVAEALQYRFREE